MKPRFLLASIIVMLTAACSSSESTDGTDEPADPVSIGQCAPDTPDCVDTIVIDDDGPADPGAGMLDEGGLTVPEALATDAAGAVAVRGFYFEDAEGRRLCELLAESLPPLCGGAELPLGDSAQQFGDLRTSQGVIWSDQPLIILGEIVDGILVPDDLAQ